MQSGNQNLFSLDGDGPARGHVSSPSLASSPLPPQLGELALSIILRVASVRLRTRAVEMEPRCPYTRQGIEPKSAPPTT